MNIHKRSLLFAMAAIALSAAQTAAQAADSNAVISSSRILNSLSRDVVLDRPSPATQTPTGSTTGAPAVVATAPQPSMDLFVQFAFNSADLLPQGRRQLDELGKALNSRSLQKWGFELAGHTDAVGSADYNIRLSLERANAVKHYLVVKHGLNPERLQPLGLGFSRPAKPSDPTAAVNRRVEVRRVVLGNHQAATVGRGAAALPVTTTAPKPQAGGRLVPTP